LNSAQRQYSPMKVQNSSATVDTAETLGGVWSKVVDSWVPAPRVTNPPLRGGGDVRCAVRIARASHIAWSVGFVHVAGPFVPTAPPPSSACSCPSGHALRARYAIGMLQTAAWERVRATPTGFDHTPLGVAEAAKGESPIAYTFSRCRITPGLNPRGFDRTRSCDKI